VFWVIWVYFNIRNTLPKSGTFLLGHLVFIQILNTIFSLQCILLPILFAFVISAFPSFSAARHSRGVKHAFRMTIPALAQVDCQSAGGVVFIYAVCLPFVYAYNSQQLFGIECTDEVRGVLTSGHSGLSKDAMWLPDTWGQKQLLHCIIISTVFLSTKWTEHHDQGMKVNYNAVVYYYVTCYCNIQLQETFVFEFTLEHVRYSIRVWAVRCHLRSYVTNWQCNATNQEHVTELYQKTILWNNSAIWYRLNALHRLFFFCEIQRIVLTRNVRIPVWVPTRIYGILTENCKILARNVCRWNLGWAGVLKNEWWKVSVYVTGSVTIEETSCRFYEHIWYRGEGIVHAFWYSNRL